MGDRKVKVKCKICEKEEIVCLSRSKSYNCCSRDCAGKFNSIKYQTKIEKICPICDKLFMVKQSHVKRRVCCSMECSKTYRSKFKIGENNSNYRTVNVIENGILKKNYDRYKDPYHKIVKDYFNVDKTFKGYDIHHRDNNHLNNEITNLVVLPRSAHMLLHRHMGNILMRAYVKNEISREMLFSLCDENEINFLKEIIDLNITHQVVIKQGELSENIIDDNQSSVYRNIYVNNLK
jgi:hypothetical protein